MRKKNAHPGGLMNRLGASVFALTLSAPLALAALTAGIRFCRSAGAAVRAARGDPEKSLQELQGSAGQYGRDLDRFPA